MIAVWESDISATFLTFRLKCSTDGAFFTFLGKLFHNMHGPAVREASFQIIGVWFGHGQHSLRVS